MAFNWQGEESRWGDRVKLNIPIRLSTYSLASTGGCIINLSLSGALVRIDVELGLHSLVEVSIKKQLPSLPAEAVTAYVSRRLREGIGIEWCVFAPSVVKDLLRSPLIRPPL
jgi:hypothetical protein